ncbi:MAG: ParB N-terminal domain-containing protein, partial [Candidatus Hodarchaeota archaeon]
MVVKKEDHGNDLNTSHDRIRISIDDIIIPENYDRVDFEEVGRLVESMKIEGQQIPVILSSNYILIDGLHRIEAAKRLEWAEIDCIIEDVCDALEMRVKSLAINLHRKHYDYKTRLKMTAEYLDVLRELIKREEKKIELAEIASKSQEKLEETCNTEDTSTIKEIEVTEAVSVSDEDQVT